MSRVGRKPIQIPEKVVVNIKESNITVKGPKGSLVRRLHPILDIKVKDNIITILTVSDGYKNIALQGLFRSLIANMIIGVTKGYTKILLLVGIGYRAEVNGKKIVFNVGYSNPINFELPNGIEAKVDKNTRLSLFGIDKEVVGETAAKIRRIRPPEPYKGKGIMYLDERIIKKAGKAAIK